MPARERIRRHANWSAARVRKVIHRTYATRGLWKRPAAGAAPGLLRCLLAVVSEVPSRRRAGGGEGSLNYCKTVLGCYLGWVSIVSQHCLTVVGVAISRHSSDFHTMPPGGFLHVHASLRALLPHQGPRAHPPLLAPRLHPTRDACLAWKRPSPSRDRSTWLV